VRPLRQQLPLSVELVSKCDRCGVDLHSCIQCVSFDNQRAVGMHAERAARRAHRAERRRQHVPDVRARTTIERQTSSPTASSGGDSAPGSSARKAFDDLFK